MDKINASNVLLGTAGVVATEVNSQILSVVEQDPNVWITAITQLAIAIATIISLFGKKKKAQ